MAASWDMLSHCLFAVCISVLAVLMAAVRMCRLLSALMQFAPQFQTILVAEAWDMLAHCFDEVCISILDLLMAAVQVCWLSVLLLQHWTCYLAAIMQLCISILALLTASVREVLGLCLDAVCSSLSALFGAAVCDVLDICLDAVCSSHSAVPMAEVWAVCKPSLKLFAPVSMDFDTLLFFLHLGQLFKNLLIFCGIVSVADFYVFAGCYVSHTVGLGK